MGAHEGHEHPPVYGLPCTQLPFHTHEPPHWCPGFGVTCDHEVTQLAPMQYFVAVTAALEVRAPTVKEPAFVCVVAPAFMGVSALLPGGAAVGGVQVENANADVTPVAKRATRNVARAAFLRRLLLCIITCRLYLA